MSFCTFSPHGAYFLVFCSAILFSASKPMAYAACANEFQQDCDDGDIGGVHHVVRRSAGASSTESRSLQVVFLPVVQNVTYYNTGEQITFQLNLTHNQSLSPNLTKNLKVVLWSQFLTPNSSLQTLAGIVKNVDSNATSISFDIDSLLAADTVSISFQGTVTAGIYPLANLYFTALINGQDISGSNYHYGPVPSQPTQYAVFPKVSFNRNSYSDLWVGNVTGYTMTITMPKLNFSLLVEITTNINDFSFMEVHSVQVTNVGKDINFNPSPYANVSYDSGEEVPFNDRAVLDFGNLTISGNDESTRKIVIEFNVTIKDNPQLANATKHWVGAGMRSGYQMLWVGQEALYVYKSRPLTIVSKSLTQFRTRGGGGTFESPLVKNNLTTFAKINLGTLMRTSKSMLPWQPCFDIKETFEAFPPGPREKINGSLALEVSNKTSPLEDLDIFLELKYQNTEGQEKLNTTHKPSPPYVAGVPGFSLRANASSNLIRIGERAKFYFDIIMRRMVSTLKVEVILPVNETSIMSLTYLKVLSVGTNIDNHNNLKAASIELNSTVGDPKLYDRATIDFGLVENSAGDSDSQDNKIMLEFEIIVNDHANVTNGSKHWVGVGVRGGKRMMWIGDVALIADVPDDRRPVLQVSAKCYNPVTQKSCNDDASLARSSKVYFNGTVTHDEASQRYADKVNVFWMIPPYVKFSRLDFDPANMKYNGTPQGPKFSLNGKLHFLDRISFSVEGCLDPNGIMPQGETYAVSPIQLSYSPYSMSAVYAAPLVPVSMIVFYSPGGGAPNEGSSDLQEVYSKGFLLDATNNVVYICQKSSKRVKSSCFSTSDQGSSWTAMDQQVCYIIGQDGSHLYGIACNNRAYMRQKYPNGAWYGIEKEVWESAKASPGNISSKLVTIEDSYSHSGDPHADKIKVSSIQWGANAEGVHVKTANTWKLIAKWKCCEN
ncbi:unnamed protein product [Porites evermanni]|uniref:Uncharacterized protein n=1 Tax=Porites evermanni TaxID=104178 RepID=A0ABN8M9K9_9CNID|nr:unnamed protein product [Porites evermanni]